MGSFSLVLGIFQVKSTSFPPAHSFFRRPARPFVVSELNKAADGISWQRFVPICSFGNADGNGVGELAEDEDGHAAAESARLPSTIHSRLLDEGL